MMITISVPINNKKIEFQLHTQYPEAVLPTLLDNEIYLLEEIGIQQHGYKIYSTMVSKNINMILTYIYSNSDDEGSKFCPNIHIVKNTMPEMEHDGYVIKIINIY